VEIAADKKGCFVHGIFMPIFRMKMYFQVGENQRKFILARKEG
jgi:hypothetical protein